MKITMIMLFLAAASLVASQEKGGTVSHMGMPQVSRRPVFGDFQGARFPASELRHLNELLAKGTVVEGWKETADNEKGIPWEAYTLRGEFTFAGEAFVSVEVKAFRKPVAGSDLFDLKHIVILIPSRQAGRGVVHADNPDLVAYVEGDLMRKLAGWNPELERERFPGGPLILKKAGGIPGHEPIVTHRQSMIETSLGEMAVTESYRGDSLILKKVVPPDKSHNIVYYIIHNGFEVLTYKSGPAGTEFTGAGVIRDQVKPDYTIKMVGDEDGRIQRIMLYSPDFTKTYDGFWLNNHELIPWSAEELEGWRRMRDPEARAKP